MPPQHACGESIDRHCCKPIVNERKNSGQESNGAEGPRLVARVVGGQARICLPRLMSLADVWQGLEGERREPSAGRVGSE